MKIASSALFVLTAMLLLLAGCGGGNGNPAPNSTVGQGRAVITVIWPTTQSASRFIHDAATHIRIQVKSGDTLISSKQIDRPALPGTSTITFDLLPTYVLTFVAEAFTDPKAVLSRQVVMQTLKIGVPTDIAFSLDNQTVRVEAIDANNTVVTTLTLDMDQKKTMQLSARSIGALDAILLVSPNLNTFTWKSDNELVAKVDPLTGFVTAQGGGQATITATELGSPQEQGKTASVTVTVMADVPLLGTWTGTVMGVTNQSIVFSQQGAVIYGFWHLGTQFDSPGAAAVNGNVITFSSNGDTRIFLPEREFTYSANFTGTRLGNTISGSVDRKDVRIDTDPNTGERTETVLQQVSGAFSVTKQ